MAKICCVLGSVLRTSHWGSFGPQNSPASVGPIIVPPVVDKNLRPPIRGLANVRAKVWPQALHSRPHVISSPLNEMDGHVSDLLQVKMNLFSLSALLSSSLLPCPSLVNCFSYFLYDHTDDKYIREAHLQMKKLGHRKLKWLVYDHTRVGCHCFHLAVGGPKLVYLVISLSKDTVVWGNHLLPHVPWVPCDGDL